MIARRPGAETTPQDAAANCAVPLTCTLTPGHALDLRLTLGPARRGPHDPTVRWSGGVLVRATRTPAGAATIELHQRDARVEAHAWGLGAAWALDRLPLLLGGEDHPEAFAPHHPLLRDLSRTLGGLRLCRTEAVFEAIVGSVLEQRVTSVEAHSSWRRLVLATGDPAPGPHGGGGLRLPPSPRHLLATPPWVFHRAGIERGRAETVRRCAAHANRLEECVAMTPELARRRLRAVTGIGPWTAAKVTAVALGDADAVPLGDDNFPNLVGWALAGEPRGSDERMLELLEPARGHRGRVLRLLVSAGISAPRRGPRHAIREIRSI